METVKLLYYRNGFTFLIILILTDVKIIHKYECVCQMWRDSAETVCVSGACADLLVPSICVWFSGGGGTSKPQLHHLISTEQTDSTNTSLKLPTARGSAEIWFIFKNSQTVSAAAPLQHTALILSSLHTNTSLRLLNYTCRPQLPSVFRKLTQDHESESSGM